MIEFTLNMDEYEQFLMYKFYRSSSNVNDRHCEFFGQVHKFGSYSFGHFDSVKWVILLDKYSRKNVNSWVIPIEPCQIIDIFDFVFQTFLGLECSLFFYGQTLLNPQSKHGKEPLVGWMVHFACLSVCHFLVTIFYGIYEKKKANQSVKICMMRWNLCGQFHFPMWMVHVRVVFER